MRRALVLLLPWLAVACSGGATPERPLRIVLVTLDTLRGDAVGAQTGPPARMPHLEERALRGASFPGHFAASSTTQPTHATLLTGLHPWEHGVTRNGMVLAAEHETVAERLQAAGFATGAVVASFPLHRRFGFQQGFDRYHDNFERGRTEEWSGVATEAGGRFYSLAGAVNKRALALLDELPARKQFLWFHYFDAHEPYGDVRQGEVVRLDQVLAAAERDRGRAEELLARARELYLADLLRLDVHLGQLFDRLDADAERFETYVLVVSDHGESFGEEGALGHGTRLDEVQLRVPLVLFAPGAARPGRVLDEGPSGSVDVHATLLALAGGAPDGRGRDLSGTVVPRLREEQLAARREATRPHAVLGMRRTYEEPFREPRIDGVAHVLPDPWFYMLADGLLVVGNGSGTEALHGVATPERLERARLAFERFAAELAGRADAEDLDPETQRALESLGYTR